MALDRDLTLNDGDVYNGMTYSTKTHRFTLTIDAVKDATGSNPSTDWGTDDLANKVLEKVSKTVYSTMYTKVPNDTRILLEYKIAKDLDARDAIKEAMLAHYDSVLVHAIDISSAGNGINEETGTVINRETLYDARVSVETESIMDAYGLLNKRYSWRVSRDDIRADY